MKLRKICQKIACSSFKVGDIVECMDIEQHVHLVNYAHKFLKKGGKYTIEHITPESGCIRFKENIMGYIATRFRKVD